MTTRLNIFSVFFLIALIYSSHSLADYPLEIIELKSSVPEEVIPVIKPFINQDGSISGMRNQLIIRTSPDNLREIKQILQQIDVPPRQLMISVRQGGETIDMSQGASADINAMVGNNAKVIVGQPKGDNGIQYRLKQSDTKALGAVTQQIRTLEGRPAFIATGQSVPIKERSRVIVQGRIYDNTSTRYEDATTGFYALPRLQGNRVTLEISPHRREYNSGDRHFETQQASTVVSGRLGEWIQIGGVNSRVDQSRSGISRSHSTQISSDQQIFLRVDEIRP